MTGPEHYREAERLLESAVIRGMSDEDYAADRPSYGDPDEPDCKGNGNLAAAQIHATLALAAATAERMACRGPGDIPFHWKEIVHPNDVVAGTEPF